MAIVRKHKGDKARVNKKGMLVIERKNGTVVKINPSEMTIVRKKASGKVVRQKWTPPGELGPKKNYGPKSPFKSSSQVMKSKPKTNTSRERGR